MHPAPDSLVSDTSAEAEARLQVCLLPVGNFFPEVPVGLQPSTVPRGKQAVG